MAVKNALVNYFFREFKRAPGRFISIMVIAALGAMLLSGIKAAEPAMRAAADGYFDEYGLMDLRITSTLGIGDEDVLAVSALEGTEAAEGAYSAKAMISGADGDLAVTVHSLTQAGINRPPVLEGRLPDGPGQAAIEPNLARALGAKVGGTFELEAAGELLSGGTYTVTAIVQSPYYISTVRGDGASGEDLVTAFLLVDKSAFTSDLYTEMYVLARGAKAFSSYSAEYGALIGGLRDDLTELGAQRVQLRYQDALSDAGRVLSDAVNEYNEAQDKFARELEDARLELERLRSELDEGWAGLESRRDELSQTHQQRRTGLDELAGRLDLTEAELNRTYISLNAALAQVNEQQRQADLTFAQAEEALSASWLSLEQDVAVLEQSLAELDELAAQLQALDEAPDDAEDDIHHRLSLLYEESLAAYGESLLLYEQGLDRYYTGVEQLEMEKQVTYDLIVSARDEISLGFEEANRAAADIEAQRLELENQRAALEQSELADLAELEGAQAEMEQGEQDYLRGITAYEQAEQDAERSRLKARVKISDAESEVVKIEKGDWHVLGRSDSPGYDGYDLDAGLIGVFSQILPVLFFVVAALACMVIMNRLAASRQSRAGELESYSGSAVTAGYALCGASASALGGLIGAAAGSRWIPGVIFRAYGELYSVPKLKSTVSWDWAVFCLLVLAGLTAAAGLWGARSAARKVLADQADHPEPASQGFTGRRRSLLNALRINKRFWINAAGIGCCTALLVLGFSLHGGVLSVPSRQFGEIFSYDLLVLFDEDAPHLRQREAAEYLENQALIETGPRALVEPADFAAGERAVHGTLVAPAKPELLDQAVRLREPGGGQPIALTDGGVVVTEKLAELLQLDIGGEFSIDGVTVTVAAIAENYLGHYVYMSPDNYRQAFGLEPEFNAAYLVVADGGISGVTAELSAMSAVDGVSGRSAAADRVRASMRGAGMAALVIIIAAAALALVVLYGLANNSLAERAGELARQQERGYYCAKGYLLYAFMVLTGILAGLILGLRLRGWLLLAADTGPLMLAREMDPTECLYAAAIAAGFAVLSGLTARLRLK